jgi:hypothetical protein
MLRFLSDPLWRAYTSTYVEGYRLLRAWLDARPPTEPLGDRYRRLLDEPLTPAAVRTELASTAAASPGQSSTKSIFSRTPQSGQHQSSGTSRHGVPAGRPPRGSPADSS